MKQFGDDCHVEPLGEKLIKFHCGHLGPKKHRYHVDGKTSEVRTIRWWNSRPKKLCPECRLSEFQKQARWCKKCERWVWGDEKLFYGCRHWFFFLHPSVKYAWGVMRLGSKELARLITEIKTNEKGPI